MFPEHSARDGGEVGGIEGGGNNWSGLKMRERRRRRRESEERRGKEASGEVVTLKFFQYLH